MIFFPKWKTEFAPQKLPQPIPHKKKDILFIKGTFPYKKCHKI